MFPAQVDQITISESAKFRSSNRLPSLTYYDRVTGTAMFRCSQPCTSFYGSRNRGDEDFVRWIGMCNNTNLNKSGFVEIYDARPVLNARAQKLKGGGYEACGPGQAYENCKIVFGDIDNIHVVRDAFHKVHDMNYINTANDKSAS